MMQRWIAGIFVSCLIVGSVAAQSFPNRSLRIVTAGAGGGADLISRMIAQGISAPLGQTVVVENRAGASGTVAAQTVARATPDGHTMLFYSGSVWLLPYLQDNLPYDPVRDFAPVILVDTSPTLVVVNPALPVKTVKDLIALVRSKPGKFNYASAGTGGTAHLAAELFKSMAKVDIVHVAFKSTGSALNDLLGNRVQLMFPSTGGVASHIKAGRLRALAVGGPRRSALVPELPTVAESGLPGYELESAHAMFVPSKTPAPVIRRLNREIDRWLRQPSSQERLQGLGVEAAGGTEQQLAVAMKAEMRRLGKVIKDAGIRAQ